MHNILVICKHACRREEKLFVRKRPTLSRKDLAVSTVQFHFPAVFINQIKSGFIHVYKAKNMHIM